MMPTKEIETKRIFLNDIRNDIESIIPFRNQQFLERDILNLPTPVQKYFRYSGFVGKLKMENVRVYWKEVYLKMAPNKKWRKIQCIQYNSVNDPTRLVYMSSNLYGIFSFEGYDSYQNGNGRMLIKLLKRFKVGDSRGIEMDNSELVTILAEALFIPNYAIQPYLVWETIDENCAKAILTNSNTSVSGKFYFNDIGEMIRFETSDRYFTERSGDFRKVDWSAEISDYQIRNGLKIPHKFSAKWHLENEDYEYFKGTIAYMDFNIPEFRI